MTSTAAVFMGLRFSYSDGVSSLYESSGLVEKTFSIDGPAGERICEVLVQSSIVPHHGIISLKLSTTFGREIKFAFVDKFREDLQTHFHVLESTGYNTVAGFVAALGTLTRSFQSFGIVERNLPDASSILLQPFDGPQVSPNSKTNPADEGLPLDFRDGVVRAPSSGTLHTYAKLDDARRIQVSLAQICQSCPVMIFSGLRVDYYGTRPSAFVGKWIEGADVLELGRGETITEILFFLSNADVAGEGHTRLGQVVGFYLSTSAGKSIAAGDQSSMRLRQISYFSCNLKQLDAISWYFNSLWDYPHVISRHNG